MLPSCIRSVAAKGLLECAPPVLLIHAMDLTAMVLTGVAVLAPRAQLHVHAMRATLDRIVKFMTPVRESHAMIMGLATPGVVTVTPDTQATVVRHGLSTLMNLRAFVKFTTEP